MNSLLPFYDLVIFGAGCMGLAAARRFSREGLRVLLLEASGDLFWEATRTLENRAACLDGGSAWEELMEEFRVRRGANTDWFDPAFAEAWAASEALNGASQRRWHTLFYSPVVEAHVERGLLGAVTVAGKNGWRTIRAARWIDASEAGLLVRYVEKGGVRRSPIAFYRSAVLHTHQPEELEELLKGEFKSDAPEEVLCSVRNGERRLRWRFPTAGSGYQKMSAFLEELRHRARGAAFTVSHTSLNAFPVYGEGGPVAALWPENLAVVSPVFRSERLDTPGERYKLGDELELSASAAPRSVFPHIESSPPQPEVVLEKADVVVAGGGTAGAIAALAAARNGANTTVIEMTERPGGIGTVGMITCYFHGETGGIHEEIDAATRRRSFPLIGKQGAGVYWHHEAKAWALMAALEEENVQWLGNALLCSVEKRKDGTVEAVLAVIDGRLTRVPARAFIDATGDGDLSALAGAETVSGRVGDRRVLAFTQGAIRLFEQDGDLLVRPCNYDAGWVDATNAFDLSRARLMGLSQYLRRSWDHEERPVLMAPLIGLRQSRHVVTDEVLDLGNIIEQRRLNPRIGSAAVVMDTHSVDYEFESDELAFYLWTCRSFREKRRFDLPYGMLLPKGLANVWIACRAAGVSVEAAYGLRMQRDVQRLGEAAGTAAALAVRNGDGSSRGVNSQKLQSLLSLTNACRPEVEDPKAETLSELLLQIDQGIGGLYLWRLYRWKDATAVVNALKARLNASDPNVAFLAAAVLAMRGEAVTEERLIRAIEMREEGPSPDVKPVAGPFGVRIDLPFWLQAVVLLRKVGTAKCLQVLAELSQNCTGLPFNVRTTLACTWRRLAERLPAEIPSLAPLLPLLDFSSQEAVLLPSHSVWNALHGLPQKKMLLEKEASTEQDHSWQLHLVIEEIAHLLGLPVPDMIVKCGWENDERGFVRGAFSEMRAGGKNPNQ